MQDTSTERHRSWDDVMATAGALVAVLIGGAVLAGWLLDIDGLKNLVPGQVSMKANTAAGFVVCGLSIVLARAGRTPQIVAIRWLLETLLLAIGLATLAQYLFGLDLGLDRLLAAAPDDAVLTSSPGRMAPTTAFGFTCLAAALMIDHHRSATARIISRTLASLVMLIAVTSLLGYLFGEPVLYLGIERVTAMASPTAVLFTLLGVAVIWLHPEVGLPRVLTEDSMAGKHVRALVPVVLGAPVLIGSIVAAGYGRLYKGGLAIALTSFGSVIATATVAVVSVVVLRRAESALFLKDRALAAATNGVIITDHRAQDEPIVFVNDAFCSMTGYLEHECIGRNCRFLNDGVDNPAETMDRLRRSIASGDDTVVEIKNRRKDGRLFWNRLNLAPVIDASGAVTHFVGVLDDVTDRIDREKRLEDAIAETRAAREMQNTFIRLISHELRTPLNAALTWLRLMEVDDSQETRDKGLATVVQSIESQSRLIDDLVDATRFATGGVALESETVDLHQLVETTVNELRPVIETTHRLEFSSTRANYTAQLDAVRVQQIVRNLISNAAKYTPSGGRIDVELEASDSELQFTVRDNGIGLEPAELERVYEPFWRAKSSQPGLGVGLTIAFALAKAHGGGIRAFSDGRDTGTRFEVRLPRDAAPDRHAPLTEAGVAGNDNRAD